MDFSTFCKKIYIEAYTLKNIGSQHRFIGELFFSCGSKYLPRDIRSGEEHYWTARSLFSGRREFGPRIKESFPQKINEKNFIDCFSLLINDHSLSTIAKNFAIDAPNINKELFLKALCKQFQVIIDEECSDDIIVQEYNYLLEIQNSKEQQSEAVYTRNDETLQSPVRLWLPDAEQATEEQSGFDSFTSTNSSSNFMDQGSDVWGIISAKGVGKTYLLQKMRRDMNKYAIPHFHKLSKANEWGTESVRFDNAALIEKASLEQLSGLWKVSIICLVINCIESNIATEEITNIAVRRNLTDGILFILEDAELKKLSEIINQILLDHNWRSTIQSSYTVLKSICKKVLNNRIAPEDEPIFIFIDKVDQSTLQPGAEIPECHDCYKDTIYDQCYDKIRGIDYCLNQCKGCCIGCEKYASQRAGEEFRIYGTKYGKRYEHIGLWQYIQLALLLAVDRIKLDFESKIQIYYAIRQEAFNADDNLLGANAPKITAHTQTLHYSKKEQEEIFNNTIKAQHPDYLFNPGFIEKNNYAEGFVGVERLCHPHVKGADESLFDCIYRHTFDRAREIQYIGDALAVNIHKLKQLSSQTERAEEVKRIIETTAADLLFLTSGTSASGNKTYYNDKQILLRNYWANPYNFKNLIQEIDRNLLFMDDLATICQKINNYSNCNQKCKENNCKYHPFSMLYQIGLLGRASYNSNVNKDSEQNFIPSKDITYYRDEAEIFPNDETLFILHPALTKCIEKNIRGSSIMHFRRCILGNGLTIPRDLHKELLENKKRMTPKNFEDTYYSKINSKK